MTFDALSVRDGDDDVRAPARAAHVVDMRARALHYAASARVFVTSALRRRRRPLRAKNTLARALARSCARVGDRVKVCDRRAKFLPTRSRDLGAMQRKFEAFDQTARSDYKQRRVARFLMA